MFRIKVVVACILFFQDYFVLGDDLNHPAWALIGQSQSATQPDCGKSKQGTSKRILGAVEASEGEFPWMVEFFKTDKGKIFPSCGGTLISNNHVLTAGNCVLKLVKKQFTKKVIYERIPIHHFTVGAYRLNDSTLNGISENSYTKSNNDYEIDRLRLHPEYLNLVNKPKAVLYNLAIVLSNSKIIFRENVVPACLPRRPPFENGNQFTVIGFGPTGQNSRPDVLTKHSFAASTFETCKKIYEPRVTMKDEIICNDATGSGKICPGDNVGGLFKYEPFKDGDNSTLRYFVYGVGNGNPKCGPYGTYINAHRFMDIILHNIQRNPPYK